MPTIRRRPQAVHRAPGEPETPPKAAPPEENPSVLTRIADKLFPVRPGPVPQWSRVITLIFMMSLVWELLWLVSFWAADSSHDLLKAWTKASSQLPIAFLLATAGGVPGFWFMRRRIEAANKRAGIQVVNGKVVQPTTTARAPRAEVHASSRARRRHAAKKRVRR